MVANIYMDSLKTDCYISSTLCKSWYDLKTKTVVMRFYYVTHERANILLAIKNAADRRELFNPIFEQEIAHGD